MQQYGDSRIQFGSNVKRLRITREYTQDGLAERIGIFRTYLSRIENGSANPSLTIIVALASALDVSPAELMVIENKSKPKNSLLMNDSKIADTLNSRLM